MASKVVVRPRATGQEVAETRGTTLEQLAEIVDSRARRGHRTAAVAGLVGLVTGIGLTATGVAIANAGDDNGQRISVDLTTVAVEQRDVTLYTEFAGSLGYNGSASISAQGAGVVTAVAEEGTDLARGEVAFEIDSEPVVVLYGALPEWRTLKSSSEDGPDVLQLETNLAALGYTASGRMTVDDDFTYYTGVALKEWETAVGFTSPDTTFEATEAVFLPGAIRVDTAVTRGTITARGTEVLTAAVIAEVADTVTGDHTVASVSTPTQAVTLEVSTSDQSVFVEGAAVEIELADGTLVGGAVAEVGDTARRVEQGPNSDLVVDVIVAISPDAEVLIEGPANVRVPSETIPDALMVPVRALVALLEGGYAVEVSETSGMRYVGVETGEFVVGWVQVTGDLAVGDLVVVPG